MKKRQLDRVLRAAGRITGATQFVILRPQGLVALQAKRLCE